MILLKHARTFLVSINASMIQFVCFCTSVLFFLLLFVGLDLYIPTVNWNGFGIHQDIAVVIYWATPFTGVLLAFVSLYASIKEWSHVLIAVPISLIGQIIFYITTMFGIIDHFNKNNFLILCKGWEIDEDVSKKSACSSILNGFNLIMFCSVANMIVLVVIAVASILRWRNLRRAVIAYTKTGTIMEDIVLSDEDEQDSKEHL